LNPGSPGGGGSPNAQTNTPGGNAGQNTGGGGGGGSHYTANNKGGNGGSGIVVFKYAETFDTAVSTTGFPMYSVVNGFRVYIFTGSGSIAF
jgi:hypothetical protein